MGTLLDEMLGDPEYAHVYIDISWDQVAKWITNDAASLEAARSLIVRYPNRFLFGTDNVAPNCQEPNMRVYHLYDSLWNLLTAEQKYAVTKGNYERLFDQARVKVRAWEKAHIP